MLMDVRKIKELEAFNVVFDIAIDEESYDSSTAIIQINQQPSDLPRLPVYEYLSADSGGRLNLKCEMLGIDEHLEWKGAEETSYDQWLNDQWYVLLKAKHLRSLFQRESNPPGQLDQITRTLLSKLPMIPDNYSEGGDEAEKKLLMHLLYLNEMSACSKLNLSIGYAEMMLTSINKMAKEKREKSGGKNIYELASFLNIGIGYAHLHEHQRAIENFDIIINTFKQIDKEEYFLIEKTEFICGRIEEEHRARIERYLLLPAIINKAEVLSDLNRSAEQIELLNQYDELFKYDFSTNINFRRQLLRILALLDSNQWGDYFQARINDAEEIFKLDRNAEFERYRDDNKHGLYQKYKQTKITYFINRLETIRAKNIQNSDKNEVAPMIGEEEKQIKGAIEDEFRGYLEYINSLEGSQDEEKDLYQLYLDYYRVLARAVGAEKNNELENHLVNEIELDAIINNIEKIYNKFFCAGERFSNPNSEEYFFEVTKNLIEYAKNRKDTQKENKKLMKIEIDARAILLNQEQNKKTDWKKADHVRRIQELESLLGEGRESIKPEDVQKWGSIDKKDLDRIKDFSVEFFANKKCIQWSKHEGCLFKGTYPLSVEQSECRAWKYQHILESNYSLLRNRITETAEMPLENSYFMTVLRRWQSFTPALSTGVEINSKGGGYFLYHTADNHTISDGIVVDPGFNFVENFLKEGFFIGDISAVAMTHAHVDHTVDFPTILTLFHEHRKKSNNKEKKLLICMTEGCFYRYQQIIDRNKDMILDVVIMKADKLYDKLPGIQDHFEIKTTKSLHDDLTDIDSIGYIFSSKKNPLIGFTGDTKWWSGLREQYSNLEIVSINLGGIIKADKINIPRELLDVGEKSSGLIEKMIREENHLYWPGFADLVNSFNKAKLVILAEIPEEMKGNLKIDMANQLTRVVKKNIKFLPEDIGLTIRLKDGDGAGVQCISCKEFVAPKSIQIKHYGLDENCHYVCNFCWDNRNHASMEAMRAHTERGGIWNKCVG